MKLRSSRAWVKGLLDIADVRIDGTRPWDIQVHDERFFGCVLRYGSLGLGEAYMDGWWDAISLDACIQRILAAYVDQKVRFTLPFALNFLKAFFFNLQKPRRAFEIGKRHYDIGNDLYQAMLDQRLTYSCGYWRNAENLDEAQEAKLDLICKKIDLKAGERVLDIGCGWGSFLKFAAEKYAARGVGITVSKEQVALATDRCKGLPIDIQLKDYRAIDDAFDHVISVGMFEHVGVKNYRVYMETVSRVLKDGGLFLLHTIGSNHSVRSVDPWSVKYIFPNSMVPSITQIGKSIEGLFVMEDWHNFGVDYDKTLLAWFANFNAAWPKFKERYSDRFYRMWKFYLLASAGSIRARRLQVWQIVLSKHGVPGGYVPLR